MKITESKLRALIREVITEISGLATVRGGKAGDYKSPDTKTKQVTYDTKQSTTKSALKRLTALKGKEYISEPEKKKAPPKKADPPKKGAPAAPTKVTPAAPSKDKPGTTIQTAKYSSDSKAKTDSGYGAWKVNPAYSEAQKAYTDAVNAEKSAETDYKAKETARKAAEKKDIKDRQTAAEPTADEPKPPAVATAGGGGKGKGKGKKGKKGKDED